MRLSSIQIKDFKRFHDLTITDIPSTAKLVLLTGPNGSGKTSVFEAFNFWIACVNEHYAVDGEYHMRTPLQSGVRADWSQAWKSIIPQFHGAATTFTINASLKANPSQTRKAFYIRSAYRHEPDFTTNGLQNAQDILLNSNRPVRMILGETRVSENYQRMVSESLLALYDPVQKQKTAGEITEQMIGEVRTSMKAVFDDLVLDGPGNPMSGGTFRFTKGKASGFHYKNLSGGEKAAFDLLLDFIVKKQAFNDTIYCIDEPELHMHTRLQARLLKELFKLVPDNSQLWISTHSIGMARMASELYTKNLGEVVFLDFHGANCDESVTIKPIKPDRRYWKNIFSTALDDLAELVTPENVILCEGKKIADKGRRPTFDVSAYREIFSSVSANVEFLPLGGHSEVESNGATLTKLMTAIAPGIHIWAIFDRDDRSQHEIDELRKSNVQVLPRRDLENYLWDDEIISELCTSLGVPDQAASIVQEKQRLLGESVKRGKAPDDIKSITGELYNFTKTLLRSQLKPGFGNNAEAFAITTLAPLFSHSLAVNKELAAVVLAPLHSRVT